MLFAFALLVITSAPSFAQGRYIVVESTDFSDSPWDNQFWVFFPDYTMEAGDEWEWSMEVKADKEATINTQINVLPGHYLSSGGFGREFPFTTEWETVNGMYECNDADEGGQSVAFYLSTLSEANKYYFRNISVKVNGKEVVRNGDLSNDDFSSFYWWRSLDGGLDGVYPDPDLITTDMVYGTTVKVDPIPYAIFDESTGTLTFYYNNNKPDGAYGIRTDYDNEWSDVKDKITKVIFNASFADYRPTSCAAWFAGLSNLTEIIGMEYLNTEKVTDMSSMFSGCKKLTSIDISNFNMTKVTNTNSMFAQCTNLQTIYVGDVWTTNNVTKSESMFYDCTSLIGGEGTTYDANYTDATYARIDVPANDALGYFTNINVSPNRCIVVESTGNFDGYVTPWNDIFWVYFPDYTVSAGDVWKWSIEVKADKKATTNTYMHSSVGQFHSVGGFGPVSFSKVWEPVNGVHECVAADEGGQSVAFYLNTLSEANKYYFRNISVKVNGVEVVRNGDLSSDDFSSFYWKTDGREPELVTTDNLYWTYVVDEPVPYGTFNKFTGTVTLGYGTTLPNNAVQFEPDNSIVQEILSSLGYTDNVDVTKIVISPSFANFKPTTTASWFYNLRGLTKIDGLQYLNTEDVTNMMFMFGNCESLSSLDLSSFNTEKLELTYGMFGGCENLKTIYVSYDWVQPPYIQDMFNGCNNLIGGAGSWVSYLWGRDNIAKIDEADNPGAFTKSPKETRTPVSIEIKTPLPQLEYVKGESLYIGGAQLTVTFDDGSEIHPWLAKVNITGYDPIQVGEQTLTAEYLGLTTTFKVTVTDDDAPYCILDENTEELTLYYGAYQPGCLPIKNMYDNRFAKRVTIDKSFKNYKPTVCGSWFSSYYYLTEIIGMENLNTEDVIDMSDMFGGCRALTSLDLSNFNTEKVVYMSSMFYGCSALTSLDLSNFNTEKVEYMSRMFSGCENLKTIYVGNQWITNNANGDEMFNGCTSLVGGKGTTYDENYIDATYVRIDDPANDAPGYFTMKNGIFIDDEDPSEIVADLYDNGLTTLVEAETEVDKVVVHREFDEDTPSTIVMPIDMEVGEDMNGYKFYEFGGVTRNSEGKWVATYNQVDHIYANKPYIVQNTSSSDDALVFEGGSNQITLKPLAEGEIAVSTGTGDNEGWEFVGAYEKKVWETDSPNEFGFAAKDVEADGIKAGDFVRIGAGASLKPMRSYLRYTKDDDPFISKAGKVLPHEIEVHLIPLASVVKPEEPEEPEDGGDIKTPISENVVDDGGVRVWSYDKTIVIAAKPGAEYQIFDANGRLLKSSVTQSDRDEVSLARTGSGIAVVRIGAQTFKVKY